MCAVSGVTFIAKLIAILCLKLPFAATTMLSIVVPSVLSGHPEIAAKDPFKACVMVEQFVAYVACGFC